MTPLAAALQRRTPGRTIDGIAAALLPFRADGSVAEQDYAAHLRATHAAGLRNAVNMDTGYVNLLAPEERRRVLELARAALGPGVPFVAGAFIEGEGDILHLYRREIEPILAVGGTPILFQSQGMHGLAPSRKAELYGSVCRDVPGILGFELSPVFAPSGEIWDEETFLRLLQIPELAGVKHSSLSKTAELRRLELRDRERPEFRIYTGNDWGIDMVEFGSDYLLGLATFCPELFAARDRMWATEDAGYLELSEALQYLGAVAFRAPVPAYKQSAAWFLHLQGRLESPRTHPRAPERPEWEPEILRTCLDRLGLAAGRAERHCGLPSGRH